MLDLGLPRHFIYEVLHGVDTECLPKENRGNSSLAIFATLYLIAFPLIIGPLR